MWPVNLLLMRFKNVMGLNMKQKTTCGQCLLWNYYNEVKAIHKIELALLNASNSFVSYVLLVLTIFWCWKNLVTLFWYLYILYMLLNLLTRILRRSCLKDLKKLTERFCSKICFVFPLSRWYFIMSSCFINFPLSLYSLYTICFEIQPPIQ